MIWWLVNDELERIAIFKVICWILPGGTEKYNKYFCVAHPWKNDSLTGQYFTLFCWFAEGPSPGLMPLCSTVKMETASCSRTLVMPCQTPQHHIPVDWNDNSALELSQFVMLQLFCSKQQHWRGDASPYAASAAAWSEAGCTQQHAVTATMCWPWDNILMISSRVFSCPFFIMADLDPWRHIITLGTFSDNKLDLFCEARKRFLCWRFQLCSGLCHMLSGRLVPVFWRNTWYFWHEDGGSISTKMSVLT